MKTKICNKCNLEKSTDEFYLYGTISGIYYSAYCNDCKRIINRENHKRLYKNRYNRIKLEIFFYYSHGKLRCNCCGESEYNFLSLDHINNNGAEDRKINGHGYKLYFRLKKLGFPIGYQILCFNCNLSKGFFGICPHINKREEMHNLYA